MSQDINEFLSSGAEEVDQEGDIETRRIAFFADSRTSTIGLERTIEELITSENIAHGVVELNTIAGVTIAATLLKHHIPYDVMLLGISALSEIEDAAEQDSDQDYNPETPATLDDAAYLYRQRADVVAVNPEHPYLLGARLVVIPAMTGSGEHIIDLATNAHQDTPDFSPATMPGHLMLTLEEAQPDQRPQQDVLMIDVPERGLIQLTDRSYARRMLLLTLAEDEEPEVTPEATQDTPE